MGLGEPVLVRTSPCGLAFAHEQSKCSAQHALQSRQQVRRAAAAVALAGGVSATLRGGSRFGTVVADGLMEG